MDAIIINQMNRFLINRLDLKLDLKKEGKIKIKIEIKKITGII
tara:strand:- start:225 stop:353 length:129 start_codon:yes stop_codon:yes gene_type:complete